MSLDTDEGRRAAPEGVLHPPRAKDHPINWRSRSEIEATGRLSQGKDLGFSFHVKMHMRIKFYLG